MEKKPSPLILDSLRIDINDLKDDYKSITMRDENGYILDERGTYYYNMCLVVAKRFMLIVEEFDKLGFSQEQLNTLIENLLDKLCDELEDFKFETSGEDVDATDFAMFIFNCFDDAIRAGWKVDFPNFNLLYKKRKHR